APILPHSSRNTSALARETLNTMSVPGSGKSVSPLPYHLKSRSPPSPNGCSGLSFGPATNPSSDIDNSATTFPILHYLCVFPLDFEIVLLFLLFVVAVRLVLTLQFLQMLL